MGSGLQVDAASKDINFWGRHANLFRLADWLKRPPYLPNKRELTFLPPLRQLASPVSLVLCKLYNLRHFSQEDRHDLLHLELSLQASRASISDLAPRKTQFTTWNCNRLIRAQREGPNQRQYPERNPHREYPRNRSTEGSGSRRPR